MSRPGPARFGRPCEYHAGGFAHPGVKVESSRWQLLVSKPSRRHPGGDWDIGCRLSKDPALGLSSPIYSRRRMLWIGLATSLYLVRLGFKVPCLEISGLDYTLFIQRAFPPLPTFPVHKSPLFNRLPAQARHGMRWNLTLTLKFVGVPCLSLPAGI